MVIFEICLLAVWATFGGMIAHQLDAPWYHKIGIAILWPIIGLYIFCYHVVAVWLRRFY